MTLSQTLPKAWTAFTENKKYLLFIILIEFVFLFLLTQAHLYFFVPSAEAATMAGEAMSKQVEAMPETELYQLETKLAESKEFMVAYRLLLTYIIYFILSILALFIVFRTPLWYLSHKSIYKKMPFKPVMIKFPLMTLFWFAIICVAFVIYSIATGSTATILPLVSSDTATFLMLIILLAVFYFSQISFALIPAQQTFKKTFTYGVKHAKSIIPAFLVNASITFIVLSLPFNWIATMPLLSLAIILIITIPALAFARLHMIVAIWEKHS